MWDAGHTQSCMLPRAATPKCHQLGGLQKRNYPLSSGGWEQSETKVPAGWVPSEAVRERVSRASRLASDGSITSISDSIFTHMVFSSSVVVVSFFLFVFIYLLGDAGLGCSTRYLQSSSWRVGSLSCVVWDLVP